MNAVACLVWYEARRNAWVLQGAIVGLICFAGFLWLLPDVWTGADLAGIPTGDEDRDPRFQSRIEIDSEQSEDGGVFSSRHFEWSFDSTRDPTGQPEPAGSSASGSTRFDLPDELQFAFRPRQPAALIGAMFLAAATLLGLFVAHLREAERGEMTLHYQSPVAAETQLGVRFLFSAAVVVSVFVAALAIYAGLQNLQSLSPTFPVAEGFGRTVRVEWSHWILVVTATQILPAAAYILLFVQIQNAYALLVTLLAGLAASLLCFERWGLAASEAAARLPLVRVSQAPRLVEPVTDFDLDRFRYDVPVDFVVVGALATLVMLALASRIFREAEWS